MVDVAPRPGQSAVTWTTVRCPGTAPEHLAALGNGGPAPFPPLLRRQRSPGGLSGRTGRRKSAPTSSALLLLHPAPNVWGRLVAVRPAFSLSLNELPQAL